MRLRRIAALLVALILLAFTPPARAGGLVQATVAGVVDGDTLRLRVGQREDKVRLIGVDAPEAWPNPKFRKEMRRGHRRPPGKLLALGREAKAFVMRMAPPGKKAAIELDVQERDRYGRLLAYVWISPGDGGRPIMLNAALVSAGLATVMTIPPNVRRAGYFRSLQEQARREGRGIWRGN